ncbi:MAG: hypothetical protein CMJ58_20590 [Planctomycetaceae bacterium]|nr:hypothetical protein [Planctomycetaceae bacterium]
MVLLSHVLLTADASCAERFANQFVPRFQWANSLVAELYSREVYAQRAIRADTWGLFIVCNDTAGWGPTMVSPVECRWPLDFNLYLKEQSDGELRQFMLDAMHAAALWAAKKNSWPTDVFEQAYEKVLQRGLHFHGLVNVSYPTPDKRFTARIHCDYGIEWVRYCAVLCRYRSKKPIATIPLGKMRPAIGRVADDVAGGKWVRDTQFVLSSGRHYDWVADFSQYMK